MLKPKAVSTAIERGKEHINKMPKGKVCSEERARFLASNQQKKGKVCSSQRARIFPKGQGLEHSKGKDFSLKSSPKGQGSDYPEGKRVVYIGGKERNIVLSESDRRTTELIDAEA